MLSRFRSPIIRNSNKISKNIIINNNVNNMIISMNMSTYKTSTGLVGLLADPDGKSNLIAASNSVLQAVKKIPECQYRTNVEKWFTFIKNSAEATDDIKTIEKTIEMGQIEEIIVMAKDELELVDYYYENKIWEKVEEARKTGDEVAEAMSSSIYFSQPEESKAAKKAREAASAAAAPKP